MQNTNYIVNKYHTLFFKIPDPHGFGTEKYSTRLGGA